MRSHRSLDNGQQTTDYGQAGAFPFAAVVGLDMAKQALLLLAVDPGLKGAVIMAPPGRAKSVLARSLAALLPPLARREPAHTAAAYAELPLNVTEDRLLGGLDVARTLAAGRRQFEPGLLHRAHGGLLYVDGINLLEPGVMNHLLAVLDTDEVRVEREGLSATYAAGFVLVGTCDPAEAEVRRALLDRIGLVATAEPLTVEARAEILRRLEAFDRDPAAFAASYAAETARLEARITRARRRLPRVGLSQDDRRRVGLAALRLGLEGNRADIFAARAARASAAWAGRNEVAEQDLAAAVRLVLLPRATDAPLESQQPAQGDGRAPETEATGREESPREPETQSRPPGPSSPGDDLLIEALVAELPEVLARLCAIAGRKSDARTRPSAQARQHDRDEALNRARGRHVKSLPLPARRGAARVDLIATVRAAAPLQPLRQADGVGLKLKVLADDLRYKQFRRRAGTLYIFAVDASGSMALNRMAQAKGALTQLLQRAYLRRDKVALLSFRRDGAEVLLPPCQSVARAKRSLEALPVGGATPLAAGLVAALELVRRARLGDPRRTVVVLFTDGRANVGFRTGELARSPGRAQAIERELVQLGLIFRREAIPVVVVDTQLRFTSAGEGARLAAHLGGRYAYLPRADARAISEVISAAAP